MDELTAKKVLKETRSVLDAHHIEYWLNFGCLLGAVREGRFISYDDDIELNAWKHKVTEKQVRDVSRELCRRGFNVYYSTLTDYISIRKGNIPIAFSMYTLKGDKAERPHDEGMVLEEHEENVFIPRCFYYLAELFSRQRVGRLNVESISSLKKMLIFLVVSMTSLLPKKLRRKLAILFRKTAAKLHGGFGKTRIPARFYLELEDFEFYGMIFKVPKCTDEYLEFVYGPDWRIPIKDWKFHDDGNRDITGIEIVDEPWEYTCN